MLISKTLGSLSPRYGLPLTALQVAILVFLTPFAFVPALPSVAVVLRALPSLLRSRLCAASWAPQLTQETLLGSMQVVWVVQSASVSLNADQSS